VENPLLWIVLAVCVNGLVALTGGLIPLETLHRRLSVLLAFGAGTLIAVAWLDLIPEAAELAAPAGTGIGTICALALSGFVAFYLIEQFLGMHSAGQHGHRHGLVGPFLLVGDALHNFADGVAIAVAFLAGPSVGVATTLAVVLHELPQEVSDFAILLAQGYSRARALSLLLLVQFTALLGALGAYFLTSALEGARAALMAIAAGSFLYIAAADLLPELLRRREGQSPISETAAFLSGVGIIAIFSWMA
jgi:zinc and cadmium transporter